MLSRITLAFIILIIGGAIQVNGDIDCYLNEDIVTPNEISNDWLMVRPGENATISFEILLDKGHTSVAVPVPKLYTYIYSDDNSYRLPTEERTYEYLTCSAYDKANITAETLTVPVNVTVLENDSIFHINYMFAPPESEYNNSTVFFIQNIEDVSYIVNELDDVFDLFWILLLFVPVVMIVLLITAVAGFSSTRRRRSRERERERERNMERLRILRSSLDNYPYRLSSHISQTYTPSKELMNHSPPPPPTVFRCRNKKDGIMREFVKGDGMFEVSIKKFKVPSFDKQVEMINNLPEIESFNPTTLELVANLNEYGKYFLKLKAGPTAYRVENDETMSYRNPYIHNEDFSLCLGTGQKLYNRCFENKNYVECIRILCEVLKSKHGSGYRKWSDC